MLSENYPYMIFNQEMRKVYQSGVLGKVLFAEGEYNHPFDMDVESEHKQLRPYPNHWRNFLPRSYYITHSLAPLMYITGSFPVRVSAMPVFEPFNEYKHVGSFVGDRATIITCLNDDNSVFRVTGCAAFGGGLFCQTQARKHLTIRRCKSQRRTGQRLETAGKSAATADGYTPGVGCLCYRWQYWRGCTNFHFKTGSCLHPQAAVLFWYALRGDRPEK